MEAEEQPADSYYAVTVVFELQEDAAAEFHRLVSENARESVALEPDCVRFDVMTPADAGGPEVFLYEIYTDRAAFDRHLASPHFKSFDARSQRLVRSKTVREYRVLQNAKA